MSCYLEELSLFNPMIDNNLFFTSSDLPEISVKPLRLKGLVDVSQFVSSSCETRR